MCLALSLKNKDIPNGEDFIPYRYQTCMNTLRYTRTLFYFLFFLPSLTPTFISMKVIT